MRIIISLLDFQPGNSGGIETYVRDLIEALQDIDTDNQYFIMLNLHNRGTLEVKGPNFNLVYADADEYTAQKKILRKLGLLRSKAEATIRHAFDEIQSDLIHFPLQTIPHYLQDGNTKKIITIVDIQHEFYPDFFTKADLKTRRSNYLASITTADKIISISDFTKRTLVDHYKLMADKVVTVHLSFNEKLFRKKAGQADNTYGRYFYYPAATWPHKNHKRLLKAFAGLSRYYTDCQLVLTGVSKQKTPEIASLIRSLGLGAKIHMLGYIERSSQAALYKNAVGLIFPSLFEGFGIPLLEAMAMGCPIAASKIASIPEVAGKAAIYFNPENVDEIRGAMEILLKDNLVRKKLIAEGYKQVSHFDSQEMAKATLHVYEEVVYAQ